MTTIDPTNVKGRLQAFIEFKGTSEAEFERLCGLSNGYVSNIRRSVGPEKVAGILRHYPDLNVDWLLTGRGSMSYAQTPEASARLTEIIAGRDAAIEALERENAVLRYRLTGEGYIEFNDKQQTEHI